MSDVMAPVKERLANRPSWLAPLYAGNASAVIERGFRVIRNANWGVIATGFFEPVLYLLAMGVGMGALVGRVPGPDGREITYAMFIAPALLATSAMNGAIYDSVNNVFFKLRYSKVYEGMLQTSLGPMDVALGEIFMALFRGLLYAVGFLGVLGVMGLVTSWWALAMIPVALLIALGFASLGMAVTSFMKSFQQLDLVPMVLLPMFLFSSTLFPISVYPGWVQGVIQALPLWHGVELMRQLSIGFFSPMTLVHLSYFAVMTVFGVTLVTWRLRKLFLR
ncbi:ABC transporter permease [Propioniciclava sinopodophylli]|uniref:ABC transporter permease n=1 Tax=Propioniciclava sinopodophylli TaxID=1837344 RepID=UPI002490EF75|nr:ABC transporter permease [Propioniciclava sinopodophylli]